MLIESKSNEKVKQAVLLAESAKARRQYGQFLLEGMRLCGDAALTGTRILRLFYTRQASLSERFSAVLEASEEAYEISESVCEKLAQTKSAQGIFCVCEIPENSLTEQSLLSGACFVALENIQDPANLGAVCRTAEALGISGAILSGCCDIYNPKAQRAAMGSLLRLPVMQTDSMTSLLKSISASGVPVYAAVPDSEAVDIRTVDFSHGGVVVIGNEANGVSRQTLELCKGITIPMAGRAESLNASAAAAIVMWEIMR